MIFTAQHKKYKKPFSVRQQLGELAVELGREMGQGMRELGKDVVKGVTMLPKDLLIGTGYEQGKKDSEKGEKEGKSWAEEWLKDTNKEKPPISDKTGEHTPIDAKTMLQSGEDKTKATELARVRSLLHGRFSRSSGVTEEEKRRAGEEQHKALPVWERQQREEAQKKEEEKKQRAQQPKSSIGAPVGKVGRGSIFGRKKKKAAASAGLEQKPSKGHQ